MPLTWDSTNTALDLSKEEDRVLQEVAVFATMAAGINHITEANCLDFYKRVSMWERVNGAYRHRDYGKTDHFFSPEDVVRLIGLRTNASPKTQAQFNKSVWESHDRWNFGYQFQMPLDSRG